MGWRENLVWADESEVIKEGAPFSLPKYKKRKASFRGALFSVFSSDTNVGRRNVVHQYPFRDEAYVEDLGLDTDEFSITGYVIQNIENDQNYFTERDALIEALKETGPGTLVHPFLGERKVSLVGKARISESFSEGGIARFNMTFVSAEEETAPYPADIIDNVGVIDKATDSFLNDINDSFGDLFDASDVSLFSLNSVQTAIDSLNQMLIAASNSIQSLGPSRVSKALKYLAEEYLDIDISTIQDACELANGIIGMFKGLESIVGMYGEIVVDQLFGACSSVVRGISSGPMSGAQIGLPETEFMSSVTSTPAQISENLGITTVDALLEVTNYGEEPGSEDASSYGGTVEAIIVATPSTARQGANLKVLVNLVRNIAIVEAVKIAIRINYSSYDTVMDTLNSIIDKIDAQLIRLGDEADDDDYDDLGSPISDPGSYQALEELRSVFVKSMINIGASLAKIVDYEIPPATLSSLELAYNEYLDLDRESEIINRNIPLVKHPGFLPGGQEIEILNE
jgi:hypothetical protein